MADEWPEEVLDLQIGFQRTFKAGDRIVNRHPISSITTFPLHLLFGPSSLHAPTMVFCAWQFITTLQMLSETELDGGYADEGGEDATWTDEERAKVRNRPRFAIRKASDPRAPK